MHGMILAALEAYLRGVQGEAAWQAVRVAAGLPFERFEALCVYDEALFGRVVEHAARQADIGRDALLEEMGTWLCTDPTMEPVRRILRFSGATYLEFLLSLDELHERALMALPDLALPSIAVEEAEDGITVVSNWSVPGAGHVLSGILHAMADDYGTLAVISALDSVREGDAWRERLHVLPVEARFAPGRRFDLAVGLARGRAALWPAKRRAPC